MVVCPSCGQENPAGARFCNACAAPLDAPALETHEERKTISVVFVDRGEQELKGVPGVWRLYAVADVEAQGQPPRGRT